MNTVTTSRRSATLVLSMADRLARCATPMTKFQLFQALTGRAIKGGSTISINGVACILSSIQREDGSGNSFNLTVYGPDNQKYTCYCRTVD
jgi:hypothetical protein